MSFHFMFAIYFLRLKALAIPSAVNLASFFLKALFFSLFASVTLSINKYSTSIADIFVSRRTWKFAFFLPRSLTLSPLKPFNKWSWIIDCLLIASLEALLWT